MAAAKDDEVRTELSFAFIFLIKTQPRERRLTASTHYNQQPKAKVKQTRLKKGQQTSKRKKKKRRKKIHSSSDRDEKSKKALWSSSSSNTDAITREGGREGGGDVWTARLQRGTEKPGNGTQRARSGLKCMYRRVSKLTDRSAGALLPSTGAFLPRARRSWVAHARENTDKSNGRRGRRRPAVVWRKKTRSFTSVGDCPERRRNANTGARSHGGKKKQLKKPKIKTRQRTTRSTPSG